MKNKKLKFKRFYLHPITIFIILTIITVLLSGIFSVLEIQATYSKLNLSTGKLESTLVTVENLCNYNGIKYIISEAGKNFMSFNALSTLLISLIGLSVAKGTGLLDTFIKRKLIKLDNRKITFFLILLATISSLINEVGYVILIPLAAIIYMANGRNPLTGIIAAFTGVAFGYGATIFVGTMEVNLISTTQAAARLIDNSFHVSLTSNLFIIIAATIILSIVGSTIIEKLILPKLGRYNKASSELDKTLELQQINVELEEQERLEIETREKRGLQLAFRTALVIIILMIYMLIPGLPFSGLLLDMNEATYLGQVFGDNAYFQNGFNYMVSLFFMITGIAYGIGAKTIKNDKDVVNAVNEQMMQVGNLIALLFFACQFIAVFKKTNIGTIITAWGANLINGVEFTGLPLIILVILVIAVVNIFITTPLAKWSILAPVVVPKLMQSNISPQFAQMLLRAGDSMTKGITPLLAFFAIFIGFLNMYNPNKNKPITIGSAIKIIWPYSLIISLTWIAILLIWYIVGLPLGPGVFPTIN